MIPPALLEGLDVSRESCQKLELYVDTLLKWQHQINLIGPSTADTIWHRHILDSLQLLPHIPTGVHAIADLGSGAGFPGLVLAIARPLKAYLYEANGKKAAFLREVIRLSQVRAEVRNIRIETLPQEANLPDVQLVVSRALAPLVTLLSYAEPFLRRGATGLFHKGQDVDAELTDATKYWKIRCRKHPSSTDSKGCLLEVEEACRVSSGC
jgi:16S rRNA (guanine527-N7)-methyltransferase